MNGKMKQSEIQIKICKLLETQSLQGTAYMFKAQQILELIIDNYPSIYYDYIIKDKDENKKRN